MKTPPAEPTTERVRSDLRGFCLGLSTVRAALDDLLNERELQLFVLEVYTSCKYTDKCVVNILISCKYTDTL
jgi:hypothetical protein